MGLGRVLDRASRKHVLVKSNSLGDCSVFQAMLFTDFLIVFASSLKHQANDSLMQACAPSRTETLSLEENQSATPLTQ